MFDKVSKIKKSKLYVLETLIGLLGILAINVAYFPNVIAFTNFSPNPYWLIVIGIAARYGRAGGLVAGTLTSFVFVGHHLAIGGLDTFYDDLWLLRFPFLFLLVGFLIGEIKTVFILREDYLTARVEELENYNNTLVKENDIVKEAHKNLTVDVATTQDTITTINEITHRLRSSNTIKIYQGILDSLKDYLEAQECSFYTLNNNQLNKTATLGWKDYYKRPGSYELGQGLIGLAAQEKTPLSLKDILFKKQSSLFNASNIVGDSVLAVPVIGINEKVYGVVSIEKIPLLKLTDNTIQTVKIICGLAAASLNTTVTLQNMENLQITDKNDGLFKYHYFLTRVDEEFRRSMNYMLPVSIMTFNWPDLNKLSLGNKSVAINAVTALIKSHLRAFDILAKTPKESIPLVLLLSTTSEPQAKALKTKIITKINEYLLGSMITKNNLEDTINITGLKPNVMHNHNDFLEQAGLPTK